MPVEARRSYWAYQRPCKDLERARGNRQAAEAFVILDDNFLAMVLGVDDIGDSHGIYTVLHKGRVTEKL
jgi:hypothetical protein